MQNKIVGLAEELGRLKSELQGKGNALGLQGEETPMSMEEAMQVPEGEMGRERFVRIMDYWNAAERIGVKEDAMRAIRGEWDRMQSEWRNRGMDRGKGGGRDRELNQKLFQHMREARFSGRDGGAGWGAFYEDVLVVLGSVDRELEESLKRVTDLRGEGKDWTSRESVRDGVGEEVWRRYSGELYARVLELTKEDAKVGPKRRHGGEMRVLGHT